MATRVKVPEPDLRVGVPLVGSEPEKARGFLIIIRQPAKSVRVKIPEHDLPDGVSSLGSELEIASRFAGIFW
jgi:hypothetical protein